MRFVKRLNKEQQHEMALVLAKAFHQHDNFVYLIADEDKRLKASYWLFRFMTKVMNQYGFMYVVQVDNHSVGYITFMDDAQNKMNARTVMGSNALGLAVRFWFSLSFAERKRYRKYLKSYNQIEHKRNNFIHLYYTGILPEYKGKGMMKKAFSDALAYFYDNGYKGVCLETSDRSNVGLYKHLGYHITQSVKTKDERQEIFFFEKDF